MASSKTPPPKTPTTGLSPSIPFPYPYSYADPSKPQRPCSSNSLGYTSMLHNNNNSEGFIYPSPTLHSSRALVDYSEVDYGEVDKWLCEYNNSPWESSLSCKRRSNGEGVEPVDKKPKLGSPSSALPEPLLAVPLSPKMDCSDFPVENGYGVQRASAHSVPVSQTVKNAPEGPRPQAVDSNGVQRCKSFWKAGDYEVRPDDCFSMDLGIDRVRVHPKFLHSNATSHKWALGAFAELLDNAVDEISHGATLVNIDVLKNKKDGSNMLLIQDNGAGMEPHVIRHCMSFGYSAKSKMANTIGQYGNGFKTSTMRLGADVIVFSRNLGKDGQSPTQSIGMLSYTFLTVTGKEDIVVPMLDYEKRGSCWNKIIRSSAADKDTNIETIVKWSPYSSEKDLLEQLNLIGNQGTRVIIYNLWDDDQGSQELDFDTDENDIQIRGCNRNEKKIEMAKLYPNSRHFLTYEHSLRSYASILYLSLPREFRMVLRGKYVEHHNTVDDMMMKEEVRYKPQQGDGAVTAEDLLAVVTIGFVKDAKDHIDVQGFNVYHKNRLIKPFWRVWSAAGSDGRGVIGVLEANFVEPAHDKQGFERTSVLSRLEHKLIQMQKTYWTTNCHKVGYAPRSKKASKETSNYANNSHDSRQGSGMKSITRSMNQPKSPEPVSTSAMGSIDINQVTPRSFSVSTSAGGSASGTGSHIHLDRVVTPINFSVSAQKEDLGDLNQVVTPINSSVATSAGSTTSGMGHVDRCRRLPPRRLPPLSFSASTSKGSLNDIRQVAAKVSDIASSNESRHGNTGVNPGLSSKLVDRDSQSRVQVPDIKCHIEKHVQDVARNECGHSILNPDPSNLSKINNQQSQLREVNKAVNLQIKQRLKEEMLARKNHQLQAQLEKANQEIENAKREIKKRDEEIEKAKREIQKHDDEQESLIGVFLEERSRRDKYELQLIEELKELREFREKMKLSPVKKEQQ